MLANIKHIDIKTLSGYSIIVFKRKIHSVKSIVGSIIVAATLFCVLFGQGAHLHNLNIHIGDHFDVHAHMHAHESHDDKPFQPESDKEDHKHEVSIASDIIGTLTSPYQVRPDVRSFFVLALDTGSITVNQRLQQSPTLFDLPPPRPASNQYLLSSFTFRGPPIA